MAKRRMFSLGVVDTDAFLEMPATTQNLYFHLGMRADDDGFVANPKKILKICGAGEDDLKVLLGKRFILGFQSGIIVIKHWRMHNVIQKDRYKETAYTEEKASLQVKENGSYTECIQNVSILETQVRLGKDSIGKDSTGKAKKDKHPDFQSVVALFYDNRDYTFVPKEGKFINYLLDKYTFDQISRTTAILKKIKQTDKWWAKQPVIPSVVYTHWERILESTKEPISDTSWAD